MANREPTLIPDNNNPSIPEIDVRETEGRMNVSSLRKVLKLIGDHPERTLLVIRNWLH